MSELKNKCTTAQQKQSFNRLAWTNQLKNETVDVEQVSIVLGGGRLMVAELLQPLCERLLPCFEKCIRVFLFQKPYPKNNTKAFSNCSTSIP